MVTDFVSSEDLVLVTGATGGLGQALCKELRKRGRAVRATGRDRAIGYKLEELGCEFLPADLTKPLPPDLTQGAAAVFHLAALSKPWGRREEFEEINLYATEQLLENSKASRCKSFIYASTPSIYAMSQDRLNISEDAPVAQPFANEYARTKFIAEQNVLSANGPDFLTTALRPRAIIGPDDQVLLPRLMRAAKRGLMPVPRGGEALIEVTDVRDVVGAFLLAEEKIAQAAGQVFNISGGMPLTLRQLLGGVFDELGLNVRSVHIPSSALHALASALEMICSRLPQRPEPLLTRYVVKTLSFSQTFDTSRARNILGWEAQYSPQQSIAYALNGGLK